MTMEKTLILIKPDAIVKRLAGNIISDLYSLDLKMIGLKLVNVQKELAEQHYDQLKEEKGEKIFEDVIKYLTGEYHENENVIAIVYQGENAIKKVRELAGVTHPEKAKYSTLRGKFGRIIADKNLFETVIHASDSPESAEREIKLWFDESELV